MIRNYGYIKADVAGRQSTKCASHDFSMGLSEGSDFTGMFPPCIIHEDVVVVETEMFRQ